MKKSVFLHALSMVRKSMKSYALLSVTIVLSLSLLLGFLGYTDTKLYNDYKELFSLPREVVIAYDLNMQLHNHVALKEKILDTVDCQSATFFCPVATVTFGINNTTNIFPYEIISIPANTYEVYTWNSLTPLEITWLDNEPRQTITLAEDEILLSEGFYYALRLDKLASPMFYITLEIPNQSFSTKNYNMRVVGLIKDEVPLTVDENNGIHSALQNGYQLHVVASQDTFNPLESPNAHWQSHTVFYTNNPEYVANVADQFHYQVFSVYEEQNEALATIRIEKRNKALITCALLLLLGINLYSCFSNALNDRKFEIGVKRAIGASGWSIVRQFLYEAVIVMVVNIIISIICVTDLSWLLKYIFEHIPDQWGNYQTLTLYISPYSILMFVICSVVLTIIYSLIFSYKATQVEIVKFLKAE